RQTDHHSRRTGAERRPPSAAGGLSGRGRDAVRLLHGGNDHVGGRIVEEDSEPDRRRDTARDGGQRLPLRNLPANSRRHSAGRGRRQSRERRRAMIERFVEEIELEPERYELTAGPAYHFELGEMQRRDFFRALARTGGGVLIVLAVKDSLAQQESGGGRRRGGAPRPVEVGAWLRIAEDGTVTAYTGKAEVGQNIRTSLTQAVAEELRAPVSAIKVVMGDTDLTPYDAGTFGSRTTPDMFPQLRKA